jgi:uncharacterized membrane protein
LEESTLKLNTTHALLIIVALSLILILIVALDLNSMVRIIIGLPFVLFFPGYASIATFFPTNTSLRGSERIALSFGLSLAIVALIGLALNYTDLGIRLNAVLVSSTIFILTMCVIAFVRQTKVPDHEKPFVLLNLHALGKKSRLNQNRSDKIILWVLIIAILGIMVAFGIIIAQPKTSQAFTDFYILDANGQTENYPHDIKLGDSASVTVGIVNNEGIPTLYRVEITIGGIANKAIGPLTLKPGQKYENIVSFTPPKVGDDQEVEFFLYENGHSNIYQELHLWVNVN